MPRGQAALRAILDCKVAQPHFSSPTRWQQDKDDYPSARRAARGKGAARGAIGTQKKRKTVTVVFSLKSDSHQV